jgi:hypothetical protein
MGKTFDPIDIIFIVLILAYFVSLFLLIFIVKTPFTVKSKDVKIPEKEKPKVIKNDVVKNIETKKVETPNEIKPTSKKNIKPSYKKKNGDNAITKLAKILEEPTVTYKEVPKKKKNINKNGKNATIKQIKKELNGKNKNKKKKIIKKK